MSETTLYLSPIPNLRKLVEEMTKAAIREAAEGARVDGDTAFNDALAAREAMMAELLAAETAMTPKVRKPRAPRKPNATGEGSEQGNGGQSPRARRQLRAEQEAGK